MKDWLLRHSLRAGAQSATSDGYELQCERHEHERMDSETELEGVRQDEEGEEDEYKEENREPEGSVINDRCLACTQCNFCVNKDQARVLVEPDGRSPSGTRTVTSSLHGIPILMQIELNNGECAARAMVGSFAGQVAWLHTRLAENQKSLPQL